VDEDGNVIINSNDEEGDNDDVVYTETLCQPENMLEILKMLHAFMHGTKEDIHFP